MSARDERDELVEAVALMGALPMPVGPEPQAPEPSTLAGYKRSYADAVATVARQAQKITELERIANAERARVAELGHTVQQMCDALNGHDCPPPDESPFQLVTRVSIAWSEAEARVAELEAERSKYVGKEPTIAEEMAYLSRCIDAVLDLCNEAERKGITSGGPFTVEAVRRAADGLEPRRSYPPTLPWAALMDDEDRAEFLGDLIDALNSNPPRTRDVLAEVEKTIAQWRLIGEAQHAHNTAPGPSVEVSADRDEPAEAPDFFQTGRTYLRFVGDRELYFRVTSVSTDNPNPADSLAGDGPVAHGWVRTERSATVWGPGGYTNFVGWHDVTESGGGR